MSKQLEDELKERLHIRTLEKGSGSSGCISTGRCYVTDKGDKLFVKTNGGLNAITMFEGERESLKHIVATKTIKAPKPYLVIQDYNDTHCSAIAMEYIDIKRLSDEGAKSLGRNLAHLHDYNNKVRRYNEKASKWIGGKPPSAKQIIETRAKQTNDHIDNELDSTGSEEEEEFQFSKHGLRSKGSSAVAKKQLETEYAEKFVPEPNTEHIDKFGFHVPTSCGSIPQVNEWTDEWVPFYARHRLDKTIRSLLSDHSDRDLNQEWSHLQLKIDKFFTDYKSNGGDVIVPALLHGDLWSGNVAEMSDGSEAVIYDPSSFYGHSEYEFGIVRMFGGIPKSFETSYFEIMPKRKLFEKRNKLYQLFHHLNHWDHFGSGYRASSLSIMKSLNAAV